MMYEMINYLLVMSWLRYVPKRIRNPDIPGIIAACFDKFIEDVVVKAPSQYDGKFNYLCLLKVHVRIENYVPESFNLYL